MHKILNGLRYGNSKTKSYIIITLCLLVFGIISLVAVIMTHSPLWAMSAIFCFLLALILMQSVSFKKSGKFAPEKQQKTKDQQTEEETKDHNLKKTDEDLSKEKETEEQNDDYLEKLGEKDIKGICVKYKVKKDHMPIMVDSCASKKIFQCPAYAWTEHSTLCLLLFEKEPRKVSFSSDEVNVMVYERNANANLANDYKALAKPSFLKLVFDPYLPTTFEDRMGQRSYKKNLYVIGKDLKVTNTSAKTMMELLSLNLKVDHLIRDPKFHNIYFESAYALNIMLKDTVLSVNEYKVKIKALLQKLTDANINNEEFYNYMNQLVQGRLITKEYAEYYIDRRKN